MNEVDRMGKMSPRARLLKINGIRSAMLVGRLDHTISVLRVNHRQEKKAASASEGAYLWWVTNSDRVRSASSLMG